MMSLQGIKDIRDAKPFKEFVLEIDSGRRIEIPSRDHLFALPDGITLVAYSADGHICIIETGNVSAIIIEGAKVVA